MKKYFGIYEIYFMFLLMHIGFFVMAFIIERPAVLWGNFRTILLSRSVLLTDYIYSGGIAAAFVNVAIVCTLCIIILIIIKAPPTGATVMSLWLTAGFALFGKNPLNMIPLTIGVFLFAFFKKEPRSKYGTMALLSATISPIVTEIAYLSPGYGRSIVLGSLAGIAAGFIFAAISSHCLNVHCGYNLYNLGFAGGIVSLFLVAFVRTFGLEITTKDEWSTGNNLFLTILLSTLFLLNIIYGFIVLGRKRVLRDLYEMTKHSGCLPTDYYALFQESIYVNMGVLGIISTAVLLVLGGELNGPTIAGILCIVAFAAYGKNLKNVPPIMIGAILSSIVNHADITAPANILSILFGTALAPIAGKYGPLWGIVAGFLHVTIILHFADMNRGLNLYNNGFVAGFIALFLVPIITGVKEIWEKRKNSKIKTPSADKLS